MVAGPPFKRILVACWAAVQNGPLSCSCLFFCTAIYDEMLIILMVVILFILKKNISKFIISIYAIPVLYADDLVSCFKRN